MIDSHCHFDFAEFDQDRQGIWQQCNDLGIQKLIIPGINPAQWSKAQSLSQQLPGVYFAAGLHPWWAQQKSDISQTLDQFIKTQHPIAIGECGLDKNSALDLGLQERLLSQHFALAYEHRLPLILHNVGCHQTMLGLLKHYQLPKGGVLHGFSGSFELAQRYWSLGFYLGIGGVITYPRANKTRLAIKQLPLTAIVLETDAPDMPPQGVEKGHNSPLNLPKVAKALAQIRGQSLQQICSATTQNSQALFDFYV